MSWREPGKENGEGGREDGLPDGPRLETAPVRAAGTRSDPPERCESGAGDRSRVQVPLGLKATFGSWDLILRVMAS